MSSKTFESLASTFRSFQFERFVRRALVSRPLLAPLFRLMEYLIEPIRQFEEGTRGTAFPVDPNAKLSFRFELKEMTVVERSNKAKRIFREFNYR